MAAQTFIPVDEYLRTSFDDGDREYVDGEILERNVGEILHSNTLLLLIAALLGLKDRLGLRILPDVRVQVSRTRYRVPDLSVWRVGVEIGTTIPRVPPFLAIEVLSPEDRMSRMVPKIHDYFDAGVEWVWIIDPEERTALLYSRAQPLGDAVTVLRTENPTIEIPLDTVLVPQD